MKHHLEQAVGALIGILLLVLILLQRRRLNRHYRDDRD
jgi:hypothetical protein